MKCVHFLGSLAVVRVGVELCIFWLLSTLTASIGLLLFLAVIFTPVYLMFFMALVMLTLVISSMLVIPVGGAMSIPVLLIAAITGCFYILLY